MTYVPNHNDPVKYKTTARNVVEGEKTIISDGKDHNPIFDTSATVDGEKLLRSVGTTGGKESETEVDIIDPPSELVKPCCDNTCYIGCVSGTCIELSGCPEKGTDTANAEHVTECVP